jgi:transcriptional regulator with XRE-family HTH domain
MQKDYDSMMKWNDRLKTARDDAGLSDTDIVRALKVSNPTVNGWMTGKTINIEARFLLPLCKLLNISPFWVMFGDDAEYDFGQVPASNEINAAKAIHLIACYSQTDDEGRAKILDAAEETMKLFPRR